MSFYGDWELSFADYGGMTIHGEDLLGEESYLRELATLIKTINGKVD